MNTQSIEQLMSLLQTLNALSSQLNDLLKQEKISLEIPDSDNLLALSTVKKRLVSELEKNTKTTHVFLKKINVTRGLYQLNDFISQLKLTDTKRLMTDLWSEVQRFSIDNKKQNEVNGSIIELNRRYTQRSLAVLRGQLGVTSTTYGSNGQSMSSKISRNITTA
ncbi:MAG: flagellar protein FlgN [Cycloclasticus sp.]|nr:flagellar protein FlgN [Cycloclasticus sp.]MBQ0789600.1 flagellar protein FlgN [Cycloclasticus sp.]